MKSLPLWLMDLSFTGTIALDWSLKFLGELVGALRTVTSGLKPDDRVVVGELWRASPGTKVTPQLTALEGTSAGEGGKP